MERLAIFERMRRGAARRGALAARVLSAPLASAQPAAVSVGGRPNKGPIRPRRVPWKVALMVAVAISGSLGTSSVADAAVVGAADAPPKVVDRLKEADDLLGQQPGPPLPLPTNPQQFLAETVRGFASLLGMELEDPTGAIAAAGMSEAVTGRLGLALAALQRCAIATDQAWRAMGLEAIAASLEGRQSLDTTLGAGIRNCTGPALRTLRELELELAPSVSAAAAAATSALGACASGEDDLDLWPVLRVDTNDDLSCYVHDYVLIVDTHGRDKYDNNAGSNMIDLRRGPRAALRAQGCRHGVPALAGGDCTPVAAAVLDMQGDDRYGMKEAPFGDLPASPVAPPKRSTDQSRPFTDRPGDATCTDDPVVARLVTQGAGFLGLGVLRDVAGNDRYTGKTGSQGAGHVFGIGILSDGAGEDRYEAVRNSQGFGLVGGIGILADQGGQADGYGFYMPAGKGSTSTNTDEFAFLHLTDEQGNRIDEDGDGHFEVYPNPEAGIGGVIDDVAACDRVSRFMQGAANVVGLGLLVDDGGKDRYAGGNELNLGPPAVQLTPSTGSQGFGNNGAVGILIDRGGSDRYEGMPHRWDSRVHSDCSDAAGAGLFIDAPEPGGTPQTTTACPPARTT